MEQAPVKQKLGQIFWRRRIVSMSLKELAQLPNARKATR